MYERFCFRGFAIPESKKNVQKRENRINGVEKWKKKKANNARTRETNLITNCLHGTEFGKKNKTFLEYGIR